MQKQVIQGGQAPDAMAQRGGGPSYQQQAQSRGVRDEHSIQVSMLALNLQSQLYQMKVQQADASMQRENDDTSAMQQLCSPVRVCLSVLNVQTQHKSFFKRATLQLTPNYTAQIGEDTYVLTVYAIIDSQLKTLIRLDMRDIDEIERLDAPKSG